MLHGLWANAVALARKLVDIVDVDKTFNGVAQVIIEQGVVLKVDRVDRMKFVLALLEYGVECPTVLRLQLVIRDVQAVVDDHVHQRKVGNVLLPTLHEELVLWHFPQLLAQFLREYYAFLEFHSV